MKQRRPGLRKVKASKTRMSYVREAFERNPEGEGRYIESPPETTFGNEGGTVELMSDGVLLLHDSTHSASKTEELPRKFKCPYSTPNLGSKLLSGTRFFSESDLKIAAENWLNGQHASSAKPG
ncbi:hypothetical protein AVEN_91747-1 [Araneus ventricosus]|uniref:Uncharacterized protein n=1 Tax=Araneus ventricosus TaxID=182803 RepID=A0A4Y2HV56_ARAVE|nr:hypothetical protein AVEN_91747-1 [Araneus ventricosus]